LLYKSSAVKTRLLFITLVLTQYIAWSQSDNLQLFVKNDKLFFLHEVEAGNTIYGLSKKYQIDPTLILSFHAMEPAKNLNIGDSLLIQFDRNRYQYDKSEKSLFTLIYVVKQGDTFFKLSRIMLGIKEDKLLMLNQKETTDLKVGEVILMGYYNQWQVNKNEIDKSNESNLQKWDDNVNNTDEVSKSWVNDQGVAIWYEDDQFGEEKFVMHSHAIPGTYMLLYNPMNKRKVKAKVIGNIQANTYPKEIQVLLSPAVAKSLGALDTRFYVKFKYEKIVQP
jgi:hypothetical protein